MSPKKPSPSLFDDEEDVTKLKERIVELEAQSHAQSAESSRLQDQISRRERDLREWEKRTVSARRRAWEEGCQASASIFVAQQARKARQPLDALVRVASTLGDKPSRQQLTEAVLWARQAKEMLAGIEGGGSMESGPAAQFHAAQRAEVDRLREYTMMAGRKLHKELGAEIKGPTFTGCDCPGCVLIIGMDVLGDHEPAPESTEDAA
jgi:hypothetical protein